MGRTSTKRWGRIRQRWLDLAREQGGELTCGLCGDPIQVDFFYCPHPLSLEIDHVNPWSYTRTDQDLRWEDTQPAHRHCNNRKSDGTKISREVNSQRSWY